MSKIPPELLYDIFGHVQDKETIDAVRGYAPDIVHDTVRHIRSPRVVQVSIDYLAAFKRLERTTNILVRISHKDIRNLRRLSHLRGLCVEVTDAPSIERCIKKLERIFRVEHKRDDQYFVFKVARPYGAWNACYHNGHYVATSLANRSLAFTHGDIQSLRPRAYFDLLQSVRSLVDDSLGRVLDIVLKYKYSPIDDRNLLLSIKRQIGKRLEDLIQVHMQDFIAAAGVIGEIDPVELLVKSLHEGHQLRWSMLPYYDIPDRPALLTEEEKDVVSRYRSTD